MAGNRNSGRRPKPLALHVLRGNPSRKNLHVKEPKAEGPVEKPDTLSVGASVVWDRVAPICLEMGTLTAGDIEAFAEFCELRAVLIQCAQEKSAPGFTLFLVSTVVDGAGNEHPSVKEHPAVKLERNTATMIRPYFDYFGLTPSARAKLATPKTDDQPVSKWAAVGL